MGVDGRDFERAYHLKVAQIIPCTEAEGPGLRFAIWLQGCPLRCPGCCNPQMLPFDGGDLTSVLDVFDQIRKAADQFGIEGVTFLGGEPTAQALGAWELALMVRSIGLSVMVFSGFTLEALRESDDPAILGLLDQTDLLVDGPYLKDQPDQTRRWIGSRNQRIHALTDRYRIDDPCWQQPNTLEIRLVGSTVTLNGFPGKAAVGLWKRPRLRSEKPF